MAFSDWVLYEALFNGMWDRRAVWSSTNTAAELDEAMTVHCLDLLGGDDRSIVAEYGYKALCAALRDDYSDAEQLAKLVKRRALCRPAADYGYDDEDWRGYYIAPGADGSLLYSHQDDRFADFARWTPIEQAGTDSVAEAFESPAVDDPPTTQDDDEEDPWDEDDYENEDEGVDPSVPVYDSAVGRWRRLDPVSGVFEYHNTEDDVWERDSGTGYWSRLHERVGSWLAYDAPSRTYLYENQWLAYEQVGAPPAVSLAEPEQPASDRDAEQLIEVVAQSRDNELNRAIGEIRDLKVPAEILSDDEIAYLFDQQMAAKLGGA